MKAPTLVNPTDFISEADAIESLKKTLIVCPVYDRPYLQTEILINETCRLGAGLIQSRGISDVTLHRNLISQSVLDTLKQRPREFDVVFWLDGDMTAAPIHIALLAALAREHACGVSGVYSKKSEERHWCAKPLVYDPPKVYYKSQKSLVSGEVFPLIPVRSGLGCLAYDAVKFERVCELSDTLELKGGSRLPTAFQSRVVENRDGVKEWQSEDLFFCEQSWRAGVPIYLAPVPFGHITTAPVMPHPEGVWMP